MQCHDRALEGLSNLLDIPDNMAKSLIVFVRQNGGTLPKKRRQNEFSELTNMEERRIKEIITDAFEYKALSSRQ